MAITYTHVYTNQFEDIPQIPESYSLGYDQYALHYHHSSPFPGYLGMYDNSSDLNMQRWLHGPSPITQGVLHAKLDKSVPLQSQQFRQPGQHYPQVEAFRTVSPDNTSSSGYSSHAAPDQMSSPAPYHAAYVSRSPREFMPYTSNEFAKETVYPADVSIMGGNVNNINNINNINPRDIEYQNLEPEVTIEDHETVELKTEFDDEPEISYPKVAPTPDNYNYDSGIGKSMRDAESVEPMTPAPDAEEASDSDYKPNRSNKRRRSSTSTNGSFKNSTRRRNKMRKTAAATPPTANKVTKRSRGPKSHQVSFKTNDMGDAEGQRFPCTLAGYGCASHFSSKNEWKRHHSTQHVKVAFWRCDLCPNSTDPHDDSVIYHNDFNRKDLFTQHLRRMHAAGPNGRAQSQANVVTEDNITMHQSRCLQNLRSPPPQSQCLFCEKQFLGATSWDERMEHVGRHFEKDGSSISLSYSDWNRDQKLEHWLLEEGLIEGDKDGWKLGSGKRRQVESGDSDDDDDDEE